jgi:signal peptidase I
MAGTQFHPVDGYRGYQNIGLLGTPESIFPVPEKRYFALGDNSYNSADSRYWGTVPEENLMGYGMFVYWPFNKHWGSIK